MTQKRGLVNSAIWNILNLVVTALGAFFSMPVIINGIGTDNYGLFSIILMIGGFAALQDFGLGEATLRYVSFYYGKNDLSGINKVIQSTTSVYLLTISVVFIILQLLASPIINLFKLEPEQVTTGLEAFRIACISFFIATLAQAMQKIPEAILRYDVTNKANIVFVTIRFAAMIIVVKMGYGLIGLVWVLVVIAFLRLLAFYALSRKLIPGITLYPKYTKDGVKEIFSFSIYSFINQIISQVSQYADRIVLGIFFSTADVGFLSAPKDIIQRASGITGAAGQALFPKFSSMNENEDMANLYSRSLWILSLLTMMLLIPLAIVIPSFLSIWISPEFANNSAQFARLFSLGMAFNGGTIVYFSLLKGTNRINWLTKIMSSLTIVSILVTVALVYQYGIIGSGIRTILFSWIGTVICIIIGRKVFSRRYKKRDILEFGLLTPISGLTIYFLGIHNSKTILLNNWWSIIFHYGFYATLVLVLSFTLNLLSFRRSGTGYFLWLSLKKKNLKWLLKS